MIRPRRSVRLASPGHGTRVAAAAALAAITKRKSTRRKKRKKRSTTTMTTPTTTTPRTTRNSRDAAGKRNSKGVSSRTSTAEAAEPPARRSKRNSQDPPPNKRQRLQEEEEAVVEEAEENNNNNSSRMATTNTSHAPDAPVAATTNNEDEDDDHALGSKVLRLRLNRVGARSASALQASLIWNDIADLDISCTTPNGTLIDYRYKEADCGGWLDVNMNVSCREASTEAIENIFWASAPSGKYVFRVTNFRCHVDEEREEFSDVGRSVPFRVFLTKNGKREVYEGSLKQKEVATCFEFELEGDGALGSFVVMPPSDTKTTFKQACEKNGVTWDQGSGYYAVARMETIQGYKEMLLQDIEKDTFTIGTNKIREKLGWSIGDTVKKGPKDIPKGYRLFVQSTSHNRVIQPGTHMLVKVSVKEALQHRPAHNTQFQNETHTMGQNS